MSPAKKNPEEVRQTRVELAKKMREKRAAKHAEAVAAGTAGRRTTQERGLTTIQVNVEDAELLSTLAAERKTSRRLFLHDILQSLYGKKE